MHVSTHVKDQDYSYLTSVVMLTASEEPASGLYIVAKVFTSFRALSDPFITGVSANT
jgi:hypothetical protein